LEQQAKDNILKRDLFTLFSSL